MTSLITTLMLATQLNVADAKPGAKHHTKRAHHTHQRARTNRAHTHRPPARAVTRPARPAPPPRAYAGHHVRWHNGYWVRTHRSPALMWRWNAYLGRWTIVVRF